MNYKLKQHKDIRNCRYSFMDYAYAQNHGFNLDDYKVVYEGNIEPENIKCKDEIRPENYLEHLFYVFNMQHPADFRGHSLSVGDVVELDGVNYYCNSCGWRKL